MAIASMIKGKIKVCLCILNHNIGLTSKRQLNLTAFIYAVARPINIGEPNTRAAGCASMPGFAALVSSIALLVAASCALII